MSIISRYYEELRGFTAANGFTDTAVYSPNQHYPSDPASVAGYMRNELAGFLPGSAAERPTEADSHTFGRLTLCSKKNFSDAKSSTCHF